MASRNIGAYARSPYAMFPYAKKYGGDDLNLQVRMIGIGNHFLCLQCNHVIYNTKNLRILWQIASDGITLDNINTSTHSSKDKNSVNLKSDVIEQYWQSNGCTSEWITFDMGLNNAKSIDTLALIGTNLSSSAKINLKGYDENGDAETPSEVTWASIQSFSNFSGSGRDMVIWISPENPKTKYRYYRLGIDDSTRNNTSTPYIRIGRLVAGRALCLSGENCLDNVSMKRVNYKDEFVINGFTSIANNRSIKKTMTISFKDLNRLGYINYKRLMEYIEYSRDTMKSLVIIDPSDEYKYEYSVYAKLKDTPDESHSYVSDDTSNVSMNLSYDEAK